MTGPAGFRQQGSPAGFRQQGSIARILLPGRAEPLEIAPPSWAPGYPPPSARRVYAAAHVASVDGGIIDWESTMRFRDHLWEHGFGVAEAMDTAQRGMGLDWPTLLAWHGVEG